VSRRAILLAALAAAGLATACRDRAGSGPASGEDASALAVPPARCAALARHAFGLPGYWGLGNPHPAGRLQEHTEALVGLLASCPLMTDDEAACIEAAATVDQFVKVCRMSPAVNEAARQAVRWRGGERDGDPAVCARLADRLIDLALEVIPATDRARAEEGREDLRPLLADRCQRAGAAAEAEACAGAAGDLWTAWRCVSPPS
jgi:hypothetical protein